LATITLPTSEPGTPAWCREVAECLRLLRDASQANGSR
jgi:hypothetical protein